MIVAADPGVAIADDKAAAAAALWMAHAAAWLSMIDDFQAAWPADVTPTAFRMSSILAELALTVVIIT